MRFKYLLPIVLLCALILLRQGINGVRELSPQFDHFADEVERRGLEPALIFYTESSHVREAERQLRKSLN